MERAHRGRRRDHPPPRLLIRERCNSRRPVPPVLGGDEGCERRWWGNAGNRGSVPGACLASCRAHPLRDNGKGRVPRPPQPPSVDSITARNRSVASGPAYTSSYRERSIARRCLSAKLSDIQTLHTRRARQRSPALAPFAAPPSLGSASVAQASASRPRVLGRA
jgi:hypothetical protein